MSTSDNNEPEPTRPNWKWFLFLVVAVAGIGLAGNWSTVSHFAHLPEIAHAIGLG